MSGAAHQEEEALGRTYDGRLMRRLLGYLGPYRGATALAVVLIGASALLQLVGPLATAVALDLFVAPDDPSAPRAAVSRAVAAALDRFGLDPDPAAGLAAAALVYLLALAAGFGVVYGQGYLMQVVGQRVMADLRAEIFGHLQRLEVAYFDRTPVGRLVTRATTDVDALNELFSSGIVTLFGDVLQLAGIVGVLFWLDWRLALAAFAVLPLLFLLTLWFKLKARASFREVRVRVAR
ncbi:MAG TPA: ABC transporter transmembrane domain-containing protein, partial [Thermoanaerobaculia bacterium]|nr:ABC transporter transmembrane domain-containing protein [Thermoanaerobaculia bacterium]